MKAWLRPAAFSLAAALVVLAVGGLAQPQPALPAPEAAGYVGSRSCAGCHAAQTEAWRASHHARAMQDIASGRPDLEGQAGEGAQAAHIAAGASGLDIALPDAEGLRQSHRLSHSLGVEPLQQYLIPLGSGAYQVFGWSRDMRSKAEGGQRWFRFYDAHQTSPGQPLHWLGRDQTFNFMCADCHVTGYRKGYDAAEQRYRSAWSEAGVGCEGCHGPGRDHLAWAGRPAAARTGDPSRGLTWLPHDRRGAVWSRRSGAPVAMRDPPRRAPARELDVCGRCHAHRSQFDDARAPGAPLLDAYRPSLLSDDLFWPDGAMRSEVYNLASFRQSRMHAAGVTCSDCHEPHGGKPRADGNDLCATCHARERYANRDHHRHEAAGPGGRCTACHMPPALFMGIDRRHDHAFSIPRPDLAARIGRADACTTCHADRQPGWAEAEARRLFPALADRPAPYAEAVLAARTMTPDAAARLRAVVRESSLPAIQRASALSRLAHRGDGEVAVLAAALVTDADPLLRLAAVEALAEGASAERLRHLPGALGDPLRAIRMAAARGLAALPEAAIPAAHRTAFAAALEEYRAAQRFNADRSEAWRNLAALALDRADWLAARQALEAALRRAPEDLATRLAMADLNRALGREADVERLLREVLALEPGEPLALHMLGLALVRQKRLSDALTPLREAAARAPENARFVYVLVVALDSAGLSSEARATLDAAVRRHAGNRDLEALDAAFRRRPARP